MAHERTTTYRTFVWFSDLSLSLAKGCLGLLDNGVILVKQVVNYWDRLTDSYAIPYDYVVTKRFESNRVLLYNHTNQKEYQCVNFCSNDMHGFSRHPTVIHSAVKAIKDFGTSSSGSYGTSGRNQIHKDLVAVISQHKNLPFSQLFINAWAASASFFYAMCVHGPSLPGFRESANIVIIRDQLNHASLSVASDNVASLIKKRMSPSTRIKNVIYSHNNVEDARLKLKKFTKPGDRIILVSDGVFSMDGDIAPIPGLLDVLSEYPDSTLYIDEAHSTGSLGKHGGGVLDYYGIDAPNGVFNAVNIVLLTTFSKYAASAGAAISSGCSELVHLMNFSPTSLLTIAIPPAQAASALASTKLLQEEPAI